MCCGSRDRPCNRTPNEDGPRDWSHSEHDEAGALKAFKTVLLGSSGAGKTCIGQRFAHDVYKETSSSTLGVDYFFKNVDHDGRSVRVNFFDTAGQERFRSLGTTYYRHAMLAILVYDITDQKTFKELQTWMDDLKMSGPSSSVILIIGNKADNEKMRQTYLCRYSADLCNTLLSTVILFCPLIGGHTTTCRLCFSIAKG
eukprot:TRINITY_DN561_c0_g1_i2.p1 TRINITY_DN561_c0_g1~~TRINITY_DN561_c0_g1_i2.p1  ORF type:complete len:232 (-),score=21.25 TRINITY_DN561_c0_g1_i2:133-729(-)